MKLYETVFILSQDTPIQEVHKSIEDFTTILKGMNAKVLRHEYWKLRRLAYPIKKNKSGHYMMMIIEASAEAIKELERNYKMKENVIRWLTMRIEKFDDKPSLMTKIEEKSDRRPSATPRDTRRDTKKYTQAAPASDSNN